MVYLPVPTWKDAMPYERRERIPSVKRAMPVNMGKRCYLVAEGAQGPLHRQITSHSRRRHTCSPDGQAAAAIAGGKD
jgi:hypothetical protein